MDWNQDELDWIRQCVKGGQSAAYCASQLPGRSRNSVLAKAIRMDLHFNSQNRAQVTTGNRVKREKTKTRPAPRETAPIEIQEPVLSLTILQLETKHCRYPITDLSSSEFLYCGRKPKRGKTYCEEHCSIIYQPNRPGKIAV